MKIKWFKEPCENHINIVKEKYLVCVECKAVRKLNYKKGINNHYASV